MNSVPGQPTEPTPPSSLHGVPLGTGADAEGPASSIQVGRRIGPFHLLRLLGTGGMGQVFLAEQMHPVQRQLALKFMRQRIADGAALARFEIERQALARMSHPAIAQVYEAGSTSDGYPYLAMEYVPGEPIDDFCERRQLGVRARIELFCRVLLGVRHAHGRGILHLDLKPANVLVTEIDGQAQPKIIDFGLAASAGAGQGNRIGSTGGTPGYMSPEQAGIWSPDEAREIDARSDVYALGVILYRLICGAPPYERTDLAAAAAEAMRRDLASGPPPLPSQRLQLQGKPRAAARLRGDLDAVIARALRPARSERYDTVASFLDDLQRHLADRPVAARPPSPGHALRLFLRRHRLGVAVGALLLLALLGGTGLATWGLVEARRERDRAALRQQELEQVSDFQRRMIGALDPARMGQTLRSTLEAQLGIALKHDPQGDARLAAFAEDLTLANATDAARELIGVELLQRALDAIAADFAGQPMVAAELRLAVAQGQFDIGRYQAAADAADLAIADYDGQFTASHPKTLESRELRLRALKQIGRARQELPELDHWIRQAMSLGPAGRRLALRLQLLRVELHGLEGGRLADSVVESAELMRRARAELGPDDVQTAHAALVHATLLNRNHQLEEAGAHFQEALRVYREQLGPGAPMTLAVLDSVASNLGQRGLVEEAIGLQQDAVELRRKAHGNEHPSTLQAMTNLAVSHVRARRTVEAIALAEQALEARTRTLGRDNPGTLRLLLNLGAFHAMAGDIPRAAELTRECLERRRRVLGEDNPDVWTAALNLVDFEIILGHPSEALRLAEEVAHHRQRLLGAEHREVRDVAPLLSRALVAAGEYRRALPMLEAQWSGEAGQEQSPRARSMLAWYLASSYLALGRREDALDLLDKEMSGLTEARFEELNPPQRHALAQYRAWRAGNLRSREGS